MTKETNGKPQFFGDISTLIPPPELENEGKLSISGPQTIRCKQALNLTIFSKWLKNIISLLEGEKIPRKTKGEPDQLNLVVASKFKEVLYHLKGNDFTKSVEAMRAAHQFNTSNMQVRKLYYQLYLEANSEALASLLVLKPTWLILHISCHSRLNRANDSIASFKASQQDDIKHTHIIVLGGAEHYRFDPVRLILYVPTPDTYEALAEKIFSALTLLSWIPSIIGILKLDDDHRLVSQANLSKAFLNLEKNPSIFLWGKIMKFDYGYNGRIWHIKKLEDQHPLNLKPSEDWGAKSFCWGGAGYFMNAQYLAFIRHLHTYFRDPIKQAIYEDVFLGDVSERAQLKMAGISMLEILTTTNEY